MHGEGGLKAMKAKLWRESFSHFVKLIFLAKIFRNFFLVNNPFSSINFQTNTSTYLHFFHVLAPLLVS